MKDSSPDVAFDSHQTTDIIVPSEPQDAILSPNDGSTAEDGDAVSEVIPELSSLGPESLSESLILPLDTTTMENELAGFIEGSSSNFTDPSDDEFHLLVKTLRCYEVTISAFTETGQVESSIKVPLQRSYTGLEPVIPSSLADTPCTTLGMQVLLDLLNATFRTSRTLDTPSLASLLEDCITNNYDFGTAYGRLRPVWKTYKPRNIRDELCRHEEEDQEQRREALKGNQIVDPELPSRRVWDLYSNRMVPYWITDRWPKPISHAWMDEKDRVDVWTPINRNEWPVPIPKDVDLNLIRIEMLNLGLEYMWLDVLCLRQKGGPREDLRKEEWKLDVPIIGYMYDEADPVVIYLSGLGRPLSLMEGDLDDDRNWFRHAWTLQEVGDERIIAGDTPDGPMHAKPIDDNGNYETGILTRFHNELKFSLLFGDSFSALADMQKRVSTNPVDKVAGLAFSLGPNTIPAYHESESLEDAWTALVNAMHPWMKVYFLFLYPEAGQGCKKWRPTWDQIMMDPLSVDFDLWLGHVRHDDEKDEDWYEGHSIEKGLVQGLDAGSAEEGDRCGELVVEDADGMAHQFKIIATHKHPILKNMYTLLGNTKRQKPTQYWAVGHHLPEERFKKVSVVKMDLMEAERLYNLGITVECHNILV
ncbi:uncharacterized protein EV420DRAFT_1767136 [Desarmillaria tabescens]|uniref:Heterokaryon incompatibility domain-containing protein n=1 Tax=Armillaria tabescens TaxID=1929756 RepID=A0AA39MWS7_ARMTA|nr:uncharacterized protein EV420DRAFT_1767136 [Desarmillaria tabescens]KAK0449088.1 hypothetical protein EV420DRAFT_1767136 [Desarmillaria tabescens]